MLPIPLCIISNKPCGAARPGQQVTYYVLNMSSYIDLLMISLASLEGATTRKGPRPLVSVDRRRCNRSAAAPTPDRPTIALGSSTTEPHLPTAAAAAFATTTALARVLHA